MEIVVDPLRELEAAISKEWLVANGLGGYASSSILGLNTRKYHGLLIVPFGDPPFQRKLLLPKIDESFSGVETLNLSSNEYPGVIHPDGYKHLKRFQFDPLPTFLYSAQNLRVEKTVFMPYRRNAVVVNYRVQNPSQDFTKVEVHPFVNFRDIHSLTRRGAIDFEGRSAKRRVAVTLAGRSDPFLIMGSDLLDYLPSRSPDEEKWYRNFIYRKERERGYEFAEDHYCPGHFEMKIDEEQVEFNLLAAGGPAAASVFEDLSSETPRGFQRLRLEAAKRFEEVADGAQFQGDLRYLSWTADSFLVDGKVVAGYHWFGCWGRDSLLSIPGLTLVTGRYREAKEILLNLAGRLKRGLIPNWFEGDAADYNCLDASLLFIYALHKYLSYTDDAPLARKLWKVGLEIVESCIKGVNEGIRIDEDGLVWSDRSTWMDARIDGRAVAPRQGKAVELNALWYNALRSMETIGERIGIGFPFASLPNEVKRNFLQSFWNEAESCLYDVVSPEKDSRIRPNQVFAVSLPFAIIDTAHGVSIVKAIREKLLTPYGLRSLAQGDSEYRGKYLGGAVERDLAYHQGTVWSWLIGPFVTAFIKTGGRKEDARFFLQRLTGDHLREAGLGTISEIFDGDAPHLPRGCISQAWSVAEVLRCYVEDIREIKPAFEDAYGII